MMRNNIFIYKKQHDDDDDARVYILFFVFNFKKITHVYLIYIYFWQI
jgi:hypothetical protein